MRIARIIEYFPPHIGGMERHGLILSQEQVKLGHEVDIFIGYSDNLKSDLRSPTLRSPEVGLQIPKSDFEIYKAPLGFLPIYSRIRRFWFNIWAYFTFKKHHSKNPYNIIHLHGDFIEAFFGGKLAKKLGIPAVITIHAGLNKKFLKPKNANYFKNISKIICVSEEIASDLKNIGVSENKLTVISSGIYLDEFNNKNSETIDLKSKYSKPIIISVGVLRINKGFNHLIDAFKEVLKIFNSATLLIIGDGLEKNNLMKQAQGFGQIKFLSRQDHNKVIEYLKVADIFALASVSTEGDREGTPTSIMEAMAAGLPIVATKVGGNPYLIKESENGLLVEEKNNEALAEAMIKLIRDENLRQKMSDRNLEDIKQKDWPLIAKQITDVYSKIKN
ncbi:MAG: glycosyltransferase family 4 protein [Parcubacteria group bacterium]|nr:glycosyltransferase family 4 protein [Parcubacteria group bacterium]